MSKPTVPCSVEIGDGYITVRSEEALAQLESLVNSGILWRHLSDLFNADVTNSKDSKLEEIMAMQKVILSNQQKAATLTQQVEPLQIQGEVTPVEPDPPKVKINMSGKSKSKGIGSLLGNYRDLKK